MKLHIISDLHLEFAQYQPHSTSHEADVIVLAGDIWKGNKGIFWARSQWPDKQIIFVAGNHEFYGSVRQDVIDDLRDAGEQTGVHFLDDQEVIIDNVRFLGSTLWTDFKLFGNQPDAMRAAVLYLTDFRVIREKMVTFRPGDAVKLFDQSFNFLKTKLDIGFDGKTIVVTHHLPSMHSVSDRFKTDILSACFASNLDHLVEKADIWIHGHTHDSFDYQLEQCRVRVLCNPRGYSLHSRDIENSKFDPALLIDV